jgi:hypothetical protein
VKQKSADSVPQRLGKSGEPGAFLPVTMNDDGSSRVHNEKITKKFIL